MVPSERCGARDQRTDYLQVTTLVFPIGEASQAVTLIGPGQESLLSLLQGL